jgi:hypothetical protein
VASRWLLFLSRPGVSIKRVARHGIYTRKETLHLSLNARQQSLISRFKHIKNFAYRVVHRLLPLLVPLLESIKLSTQFSDGAFAILARHFDPNDGPTHDTEEVPLQNIELYRPYRASVVVEPDYSAVLASS